MGHVRDQEVAPIREGMPRVRHTLLRRVVLDEHDGDVDAGRASGQPLDQVELLQPLQYDRVERRLRQLLVGHIHHVRGPVAVADSALADRIHGQQVGVATPHERIHPAAVDLPDEQPQSAAHSCAPAPW